MAYKLMLRSLRTEKGLGQRAVADRIGVTPGAVAQWELGLSNPSLSNLLALAELLHCSLDQLLVRDEQTAA